MSDLDQMKRATLLDIIRRVIANPQNAKTVADAIARAWEPALQVRPDGGFYILVDGKPVARATTP